MQTPHASKAAALESVASAELTTLAVNPKNGAKSVSFKRPIRVRLGGVTRGLSRRPGDSQLPASTLQTVSPVSSVAGTPWR